MAFVRLAKEIKSAAKTGGLDDVTAIPKAQLSTLQATVLQKCDIITDKDRKFATLEKRVAELLGQLDKQTSIISQRDAEIARLRPFEAEANRLRPQIGPLRDEILRLTVDLETSKKSAKGFEAECKLQKKRFAVVQSELASWKQSDEIMAIELRYKEENLKAKAQIEAIVQELVLNVASQAKNILDQGVSATTTEHQIEQMKRRTLVGISGNRSRNDPDPFPSTSDNETENKSYVEAIIEGLGAVAMCSVREKLEMERQEDTFSARLKLEKLHHVAEIAEYEVQIDDLKLQLEQERKGSMI